MDDPSFTFNPSDGQKNLKLLIREIRFNYEELFLQVGRKPVVYDCFLSSKQITWCSDVSSR